MKALSMKSASRELIGKGSARSLRKMDLVPAVLYGPNIESVKLKVELTEFHKILKISKTSQFLLDLIVDGIARKVTIKELQRHPISGRILHIDFYEVPMDRKIKMSIPISKVGICKGVELGGMLQFVRREIEVLCPPNSIPESITVDISDLDIGDSLHASDLSLPNNVELYGEGNFTLLTVLNQKSESEESKSLEEDVGSDEDDLDSNGVT